MNDTTETSKHGAWLLMLSAAAILMITMGARQTTGLFSPINTSTGLGIVAISFALAVGQFVWGAVQPVSGYLGQIRVGSSHHRGRRLAGTRHCADTLCGYAVGIAADDGNLERSRRRRGSFSILIGATAQRLPAAKRSFAAGFINAGAH